MGFRIYVNMNSLQAQKLEGTLDHRDVVLSIHISLLPLRQGRGSANMYLSEVVRCVFP